jgi:hypothetical protein
MDSSSGIDQKEGLLPLPLPLHCPRNLTTIGTGTGFVVRNGDTRWLTTCAHVITGLNPTPAETALFRN